MSDLIGNITERRLNEMALESSHELRFGEDRYPMRDEKIILQKNKIDEGLDNL